MGASARRGALAWLGGGEVPCRRRPRHPRRCWAGDGLGPRRQADRGRCCHPGRPRAAAMRALHAAAAAAVRAPRQQRQQGPWQSPSPQRPHQHAAQQQGRRRRRRRQRRWEPPGGWRGRHQRRQPPAMTLAPLQRQRQQQQQQQGCGCPGQRHAGQGSGSPSLALASGQKHPPGAGAPMERGVAVGTPREGQLVPQGRTSWHPAAADLALRSEPRRDGLPTAAPQAGRDPLPAPTPTPAQSEPCCWWWWCCCSPCAAARAWQIVFLL